MPKFDFKLLKESMGLHKLTKLITMITDLINL